MRCLRDAGTAYTCAMHTCGSSESLDDRKVYSLVVYFLKTLTEWTYFVCLLKECVHCTSQLRPHGVENPRRSWGIRPYDSGLPILGRIPLGSYKTPL